MPIDDRRRATYTVRGVTILPKGWKPAMRSLSCRVAPQIQFRRRFVLFSTKGELVSAFGRRTSRHMEYSRLPPTPVVRATSDGEMRAAHERWLQPLCSAPGGWRLQVRRQYYWSSCNTHSGAAPLQSGTWAGAFESDHPVLCVQQDRVDCDR
jgi:hypothetical protein